MVECQEQCQRWWQGQINEGGMLAGSQIVSDAKAALGH
jgi:hypothetical protein